MALIDSGAYSCFIGKWCFANSGFLAIPLPGGRRIRAFNADGTENRAGAITHFCCVQLRIGQHETTQSFLIMDLGAKDIIIGYSFLQQHNPVFDFQLETMEFSRCPPLCKYEQPCMNIDKEDLDSLQLPHLEDVAQDSFAQLNHNEWNHNEHFIHWIEHSDNPVAVLVSTPPFIIFALFFGLRVRRRHSDFLIRKSFPFSALGLFWTCFYFPLSTCRRS
jgi:hypothetical protein